MISRLLISVLALFCLTAQAQQVEQAAPQAPTNKAAMLVLDPTNLLQNITQVAKAVEQIRKLEEQLATLNDQLETQNDILDATSSIRGAIADLQNSDEQKALRRAMPDDWLCAIQVGNGNCQGTSASYSQMAGFLNSVQHTPQAGDIYTHAGAMSPEQHASYFWTQSSANAAMASGMVTNENLGQYQDAMEGLMAEIRGGHDLDIKGSMDINTRAVLELGNQQVLTNRLLAQMLFMQGMDAQRSAADVSTSARLVRWTDPAEAGEAEQENYP